MKEETFKPSVRALLWARPRGESKTDSPWAHLLYKVRDSQSTRRPEHPGMSILSGETRMGAGTRRGHLPQPWERTEGVLEAVPSTQNQREEESWRRGQRKAL